MDTNAISFSFLSYFPALKRALHSLHSRLFSRINCSSNYVALGCEDADAEARRLRDSWQDDALPQRQRELVDQQLRKYRAGVSVDVFDTLQAPCEPYLILYRECLCSKSVVPAATIPRSQRSLTFQSNTQVRLFRGIYSLGQKNISINRFCCRGCDRVTLSRS